MVFEIDGHPVHNAFQDRDFGKNYFFKNITPGEKIGLGKQACPGRNIIFVAGFFHAKKVCGLQVSGGKIVLPNGNPLIYFPTEIKFANRRYAPGTPAGSSRKNESPV